MKICTACGYRNSDKANFCVKCRTPLKKNKHKKVFGRAVSAIVVVIVLLVAVLAFMNPKYVPFIVAPKNKIAVMNYLEEKYPDDNFEIESFNGEYDEYDFLAALFHISDKWKCVAVSDKTGDEKFSVYIHADGEIMGDNYWTLKHRDEMITILENCFDDCFGKGNYVYDKETLFNYQMINDSVYDLEAADYIKENAISVITLIVSSDVDATDESKIYDDIVSGFGKIIDASDFGPFISVYFDKKDDVDIPDAYTYNYFTLNYWEKSLNVTVCDGGFSCEWEYNSEPNYEFETTTPFLNGKNPIISIDGYEFKAGEVTPSDIQNNTSLVSIPNAWEKKNVDPGNSDSITLRVENHYFPEVAFSVENQYSKALNIEKCKIYGVEFGNVNNIASYSNLGIDGLFIGDVADEEILVEHFGPYETVKELTNEKYYEFIDGTASAYENIAAYPGKYLEIGLTSEGQIFSIKYKNINCVQ